MRKSLRIWCRQTCRGGFGHFIDTVEKLECCLQAGPGGRKTLTHTTSSDPSACKSVLITGGGRRIGAAISRHLHRHGCNVALHYRGTAEPAEALCKKLNEGRPGSAIVLQAELRHYEMLPGLVESCCNAFGGLDAVVNNASVFRPSPVGRVRPTEWEEIISSNLASPFFLIQAATPALSRRRGSVVNILDIYAERPLRQHPVYCASKAGLAMLTRSLGQDLAPEIRVNAVAPGAILWPESGPEAQDHAGVLARVPMGRRGEPEDIARAVGYLIFDAPYVTGQILTVDGGRTLQI